MRDKANLAKQYILGSLTAAEIEQEQGYTSDDTQSSSSSENTTETREENDNLLLIPEEFFNPAISTQIKAESAALWAALVLVVNDIYLKGKESKYYQDEEMKNSFKDIINMASQENSETSTNLKP